jgi:hypothetical protein
VEISQVKGRNLGEFRDFALTPVPLQNPAIIISALLLLWRWLYYNPLLHPLFLLQGIT